MTFKGGTVNNLADMLNSKQRLTMVRALDAAALVDPALRQRGQAMGARVQDCLPLVRHMVPEEGNRSPQELMGMPPRLVG